MSALHIGRSIPVNVDDMLAGFTAENESWFCSCSPALGGNDCLGCLADKTPRSYGENIFLRGMMATCQTAHKEQKEAIYKEHTEEYSQIKRTYDSFVRRYDGYLKAAGINTRCPAEYDEFCQAKEVRKAEMNSLKKRLIRNGLPTDELYEMGEKFKAEIRAIAEGIMEKCQR